jgi:anti-sigma-K factor RskA
VNIQEYISSGIVESYVLGLASPEEQLEFERLSAEHAVLRQAREDFEKSLEQHAMANAVPPPADLKQKIWNDINLAMPAAGIAGTEMSPTYDAAATPVRSMGFAKFLAAASVILLAGSTALNVYYYRQYKTSAARLDELIASNEQMAKNTDAMQTKLQHYENSFNILKDSNIAAIAMKGQPVAPQSLTTVYWNKQTNDVYLLVNTLPKPAAGKQYQLWAIVEGQPVSAGMLNADEAGNGLVKMSTIANAQAFAITLENTGGSKTPTMPIYVVGKT